MLIRTAYIPDAAVPSIWCRCRTTLTNALHRRSSRHVVSGGRPRYGGHGALVQDMVRPRVTCDCHMATEVHRAVHEGAARPNRGQ